MKERILQAIEASDPQRRGFVLNEALRTNRAVSFSDLMTDLAPFIEAEIRAERDACVRDVEAEITEDTHPQDHCREIGTVRRAVERIRRRAI